MAESDNTTGPGNTTEPDNMTEPHNESETSEREVLVDGLDGGLTATLSTPAGATGLVVFAHGSGSSRHSPRNRAVAADLQRHHLATLLIDLLTEAEDREDARTAKHRFDIGMLAERLEMATRWLEGEPETSRLAVGYFGASTGAAAALVAAAEVGERIQAVVSRGGRPDLAEDALQQSRSPTLLIVGGQDQTVLELNRQAQAQLGGPSQLEIVEQATHLFEEPGALDQVSALAAEWFTRHLSPGPQAPRPR